MFRNEAKMPSKEAAALRIDGTGNFIVVCDQGLAVDGWQKYVKFGLNTGLNRNKKKYILTKYGVHHGRLKMSKVEADDRVYQEFERKKKKKI